ncbi:MAG: ATP-binding cassette domain-containing protein [Pseudomonadota bacterium]
MEKIVIETQALFKNFGAKEVLTGVDLKVKSGEALAVIGESGCGKSVLFKLITGLINPSNGVVKLFGQEAQFGTKATIKQLSKIGVLFQSGALFDSLNLWQNICFALLNNGKISNQHAKQKAAELLKQVGLCPDLINQYPNALSGGMRKRVALARTIAANPKVIFFDEPTTGLDPIMTRIIHDLINKITHDLGATSITITHDIRNLGQFADRVVMLSGGKIVWQGKYNELYETGHPVVSNFVKGNVDKYYHAIG